MEDLSRFFVAKWVVHVGLEESQRSQRRRGELGSKGDRLKARDDAVTSEERHEPGQTGRGQRSRRERRSIPKRGKIDEAPAVRVLERVPCRAELWRRVHPFLD